MKLTGILILGLSLLVAGCEKETPTSTGNEATPEHAPLSPWHGLTEEEINEAAAAVVQASSESPLFNRISLAEPKKSEALRWSPGTEALRAADVRFRLGHKSFKAHYEFSTGALSEPLELTSGQPMLVGAEIYGALEAVNALPEVQEALRRRGVDAEDGLCLPRTTGRFFANLADPTKQRLARFDCFNIRGQGKLGLLPTTSAWARPVEGLSMLFDVEARKLIELTDSFEGKKPPPNDYEVIEFQPNALETRAPLKPIGVSQEGGVNFTVSGSQIDWQNWRFHLRFDPRQGTILNNVGVVSGNRFRPIAYEIAMSEMFVPYQDPDTHWFYRAYFDMGEYGFGNMATELKGNDCPANAIFQDVVLHNGAGEAFTASKRVCIFEDDPGYPSWRHHESLFDEVPGMEIHNARRATNLVVRMIAVIGNYDYFQDFIFQQDGRLRIRLISTGIDATKGVFSASLDDPKAGEETKTGTLIAPHRLGVNHDHFFSYRIDLDIDGEENNFVRQRLVAEPQPKDSPRQGIWTVERETVPSERAAQTVMKVEAPALLTFVSGTERNRMGYPTAYQLIFPNTRPLVSMEDPIYRRAGFLRNNLWVTRYKEDELFSAGTAVNQSDANQGLPVYASDNEAIVETDIVAWPMIGFHHVPMAEDWPVMPAKVDEIELKPRNFFDRNPALDVPE